MREAPISVLTLYVLIETLETIWVNGVGLVSD